MHRRGPQRQVAGLRAGQRAGDRAAADRDVQRLIHTVDHIEGRLRPGLDALDAFLTHMWAVTVTGAPKTWAMQFIEDHEQAPRRWYGGAVGMIGFDGGMNTGLTLRTAHIERRCGHRARRGDAAVRLGSGRRGAGDRTEGPGAAGNAGRGRRLRVCRRTLPAAGRLPPAWPRCPGRACGCCSSTTRTRSCTRWRATSPSREPRSPPCARGSPPRRWTSYRPDLVVLSPGPGRPSDFDCDALLSELDARRAARVRRVPGAAGDGGARGRGTGAADRACARQTRARCSAAPPGTGPAGCSPGCRRSSSRPGITRCTRCPAGQGRVRGDRGDPDGAVMAIEDAGSGPVGRAVPPGVDPDCRRRNRPPGDRQRAAPVPCPGGAAAEMRPYFAQSPERRMEP